MSGTRVQRLKTRTKGAPRSYHIGNVESLGALCQEPGAETNIFFLLSHKALHIVDVIRYLLFAQIYINM